jgi:hypothetical protein
MCYSVIIDKLNRFFTELKIINTVFCPSHLYGGREGLSDRKSPWTTVWQPMYQLQLMCTSANVISFQDNQYEIMDNVLCRPMCHFCNKLYHSHLSAIGSQAWCTLYKEVSYSLDLIWYDKRTNEFCFFIWKWENELLCFLYVKFTRSPLGTWVSKQSIHRMPYAHGM